MENNSKKLTFADLADTLINGLGHYELLNGRRYSKFFPLFKDDKQIMVRLTKNSSVPEPHYEITVTSSLTPIRFEISMNNCEKGELIKTLERVQRMVIHKVPGAFLKTPLYAKVPQTTVTEKAMTTQPSKDKDCGSSMRTCADLADTLITELNRRKHESGCFTTSFIQLFEGTDNQCISVSLTERNYFTTSPVYDVTIFERWPGDTRITTESTKSLDKDELVGLLEIIVGASNRIAKRRNLVPRYTLGSPMNKDLEEQPKQKPTASESRTYVDLAADLIEEYSQSTTAPIIFPLFEGSVNFNCEQLVRVANDIRNFESLCKSIKEPNMFVFVLQEGSHGWLIQVLDFTNLHHAKSYLRESQGIDITSLAEVLEILTNDGSKQAKEWEVELTPLYMKQEPTASGKQTYIDLATTLIKEYNPTTSGIHFPLFREGGMFVSILGKGHDNWGVMEYSDWWTIHVLDCTANTPREYLRSSNGLNVTCLAKAFKELATKGVEQAMEHGVKLMPLYTSIASEPETTSATEQKDEQPKQELSACGKRTY